MGVLDDTFGAPPLSVFNTATGTWRSGRQKWLDLGIKGEIGREARITANRQATPNAFTGDWQAKNSGVTHQEWEGTSIFDPFLCEIVYRWFTAPGAIVFDPFAGGSVRGVVASRMDRQYVGVDLRSEQIESNRNQGSLGGVRIPQWIAGDSAEITRRLNANTVDLIFSCPPYGDLERYSDDPRDLSTMEWREFSERYTSIVRECVRGLREDRFAVFVVSPFRDQKTGIFYDLPGLTKDAFESVGARFYNDAILLAPVAANGALVRCGRSFKATRKLTRIHQNVLGFVKGDPRRARIWIEGGMT